MGGKKAKVIRNASLGSCSKRSAEQQVRGREFNKWRVDICTSIQNKSPLVGVTAHEYCG